MNPFAAFLSTLTKGVKAALPYFTSAAPTDLSVNKIIDNARAAGFSFREQQARDLIALLRDNVSASNAVLRQARVFGNDVPLNPATYGVTVGKSLRNFSYTVQRTIRGQESGEFDVGFVTVSSNEPLSVNEIIDTAGGYVEGSCNPLFEPIELVELRVTDARRSSAYEV